MANINTWIKIFNLNIKFTSDKIDLYRSKLIKKNIYIRKNNIRILHVTNFNVRHNGRLFYNTGRRLNNGFLKLGHTVQTLSDRDTLSQERKISDIAGSKSLNNKLIDIVGNYTPDLIVLGHADLISNDTIVKLKIFIQVLIFANGF